MGKKNFEEALPFTEFGEWRIIANFELEKLTQGTSKEFELVEIIYRDNGW